MTSSAHEVSDNSEADEIQKDSDDQVQSSSPEVGVSHFGIAATANIQYVAAPQLGTGNAMGQTAYPYPDPYYRSIFAPYGTQPYPPQPYSTQPYPPQPYPTQPMAHFQLMGIQQAGVPLPSDAVDEPVFVNAKQYHGILRRRQSRAKAESENKMLKPKKPYLHESRHLHALKRARGCGGRFLNAKKSDDNGQQKETVSKHKSPTNLDLNANKNDPPPS